MATSTAPFVIRDEAAQANIVKYVTRCMEFHSGGAGVFSNIRTRLERADRHYLREYTAAASGNGTDSKDCNSGKREFTVPVVLQQVDSAVTYQASVFLQGTPMFGVGAAPGNEDAALQLETIVDDAATRGGWVRQWILAFRDGFKYNLMAIEADWNKITVPDFTQSLASKAASFREVEWQGQACKRLNLYNTYWDCRYIPAEIATRGEFAGYIELMSKQELQRFFQSLPERIVANARKMYESRADGNYYVPDVNPGAMITATDTTSDFNWDAWFGDIAKMHTKFQYSGTYEVITHYARIVPSEFGIKVPAANTPQIWKFVVVNNKVLIYAERQTNAHDMLPILFGQPHEAGLGYQDKSLADSVEPVQDITSKLWDAALAARRRAISDRGLYDPSRVDSSKINSANPSAKIPVRPSAYGSDISRAYYPIPFNDNQSPILMNETNELLRFANVISGQNPARQGQFVKGNKTRSEFESVMGNSNGRDQLCSMMIESQIMAPFKRILLNNVLQYQGATDLYSQDAEQVVSVDPSQLRKAVLAFKVSDGLTPMEKLLDLDAMQVFLQMLGANQALAQGYNVAPMVSYLMKMRGAKIAPFEKPQEQLMYEQAVQAWQQTIMQIMQTTPNVTAQQLPPQPMPQQFGLDPKTGKPSQ